VRFFFDSPFIIKAKQIEEDKKGKSQEKGIREIAKNNHPDYITNTV
jgi:hypothetical protein